VSSLPVRASRAVLSGASSARHRAAAIDIHALRTTVRRKPQSSGPADQPIDVDALVEASLPEMRVAADAAGAELPEGSRTVDLDGPVHYVDHGGDGPPLVAVHGLGGSHANWHDLGPLLAAHHVLRARPRRPRPHPAGRPLGVGAANRELLGPVPRRGRRRSRPCCRATPWAARSRSSRRPSTPEKVRDLVLIGPAAPRVPQPRSRPRRRPPGRAVRRAGVAEKVLARRLDKLGAEEWVRSQMTLTTADVSRVSQEMRQVAVELVASRAAGPGRRCRVPRGRALAGGAARAWRAATARSSRRCVVPPSSSTASSTGWSPLSCSQALARQRPDWRLEVLEGVGHVPQIEVPERTAEIILGWLTRRPVPVAAGTRCSPPEVPHDRRAAVRPAVRRRRPLRRRRCRSSTARPAVPVVNLPNALTVLRLLCVPVFAGVLFASASGGDGWLVLAWAVFTGRCITDVVDGRLARRQGLCTDFGAFADPIADKALVGTALVGLSLLGVMPWWVTAVVIGREVAVTALRTAVLRHGVIPASRGGKLKALSQNIAVALYLLPLSGVAASLRVPVLVVAVLATVATGVDYALSARRAAQERALTAA
jgi:CDP-diacylglycerol--glycerol-3-phosphate 3-phosphatidyltransferase